MFNLRAIDLNLLPVFEAAYEERSLSRASTRLSMTQSAVSHAISRLRDVFRDELFIRQARGVLPTPVADAIYVKLRGALADVRDSVAQMRDFDPKSSARKFFVGIAHPLGPMIAVRLNERLARAAPGIEVTFSTRSRPIELERAMRDGRIDAAVDWLMPKDGPFHDITVFEDAIVAVVRHGHPALRRIRSIKDLKKENFISLRPRVEGEHPIAGIAAWQRIQLNYVLEVSEILEVFMVAGQSDLFGLIPQSMAKFARQTFGLRPLAIRVSAASVPIKLVWHGRRDADPAHVFLRKELVLAVREVVPHGPRLKNTAKSRSDVQHGRAAARPSRANGA